MDVKVYGLPDSASLPETVFNTYSGSTDDATGLFPVTADSVVVPGPWTHEVWFPSYCPEPTGASVLTWDVDQWGDNLFEQTNVQMTIGQTLPWYCDSNQVPGGPPAGESRFAIAGNIPPSITLPQVNAFSTAYGMPIMYAYSGANGNPALFSTVTASSVAPSGNSATFPLPSSMPQNAYAFVTYNENYDGSFIPNAFNFYTVAGSQTIAGNPFGVAAGGLAINTSTCTTIIIGGHPHQTCNAASSYEALPVVSLYSQAQALIGSTAVSVGANPTAVAAYAGGQVIEPPRTVGNETIYTTVTGANRAIVANSGSNTVSILDLVNDVPLTNITVGNQPVALAVSADGTTGYVANYADSTLTQVNLTTDTPITTIAVGGQPTSVALTAAGVLWWAAPAS